MLDISWNVFRIPSRISLPLGQYRLWGKGQGQTYEVHTDREGTELVRCVP